MTNQYATFPDSDIQVAHHLYLKLWDKSRMPLLNKLRTTNQVEQLQYI